MRKNPTVYVKMIQIQIFSTDDYLLLFDFISITVPISEMADEQFDDVQSYYIFGQMLFHIPDIHASSRQYV